jgi:two-component system, NarL family, invasion response regulator UvrY
VKILLVDDHTIVREGLRRLLGTIAGCEIHEAATGREAVVQARSRVFDLVMLDLNMPELGGLELLRRLRQLGAQPILVFSMHAELLYVTRAMEAGAQGYLSKNAAPDEILAAVRRVAASGRYVESELAQALALDPGGPSQALDKLSARDVEILRQLAAGRSLGEIAAALGLRYKTIANTCTLIKTKLGVARTTDLVRIALEAGVG